MRSIVKLFIIFFAGMFAATAHAAAPANFTQAKELMRKHVYHDQNQNGALGTLYCGCDWSWRGKSGGIIDHESCGYRVRAQANRASRLEWEHVIPASVLGSQRQCWQKGGRSNCTANDPVFSIMEADMHNLTPTIGEVNADRSNFRFAQIAGGGNQYGQCQSKVDFKQRVFEPRDDAKGIVARIAFYMHDRYNLRMSESQQRLFMAWDKAYPVTQWELERNKRIATIMGHDNPFVTGERQWVMGNKIRTTSTQTNQQHATQQQTIKANRNSGIYHLPQCSSYEAVAERNAVYFKSEADAQNAGYRKARNCK